MPFVFQSRRQLLQHHKAFIFLWIWKPVWFRIRVVECVLVYIFHTKFRWILFNHNKII